MVLCRSASHSHGQRRRLFPKCLGGCRCRFLLRKNFNKNVARGNEGKAEKESAVHSALYSMPEENREKTAKVLQRVALALQGKPGPQQYEQFK
uniref:Uncharacterized protein n=1 Tax=Globodera rostochiensis TaxID=31243 RepID=A0A914GYT9_GLORO